jgi:hypothetical protein
VKTTGQQNTTMDSNMYKLRNIKRRNVAQIQRNSSLGIDEYEDFDLDSLFCEADDETVSICSQRSGPVQFYEDEQPKPVLKRSKRIEEEDENTESEDEHGTQSSFLTRMLHKAEGSFHRKDTLQQNEGKDNDDYEMDAAPRHPVRQRHKDQSSDFQSVPPVQFKPDNNQAETEGKEGITEGPNSEPPLPSNSQNGVKQDDGKSAAVRLHSHGMRILGLDHIHRDSFYKEVAKKTQMLLIGRSQAEVEVLLERLIAEHKTKEDALLYVVKEVFPESKVISLVAALLQRGAISTEQDENGRTSVFHAVSRGFTQVLRKLLEANGVAYGQDKYGMTPLKLALEKKNDDMSALLVAYLPNHVVRKYFMSTAGKSPSLNFHELLKSKMEQTILGVLDSLIDLTPNGDFKVHFHLLECDEKGHSPKDPQYDNSTKSAVHIIAVTQNKDAVFHDAVRLLLRRKWKRYARARFIVNALRYLLSVVTLTFALVVGIGAPDPLVYDSPLQYARGAAEIFSCVNTIYNLVVELIQLYQNRLDYFQDPFNWSDMSAVLLLLAVIPLRFTATRESWAVFGVGYFFWTMRTFKYSAITRSTGAFAQILWAILTKDMVQFVVVFMVVLLAFSGMLAASLKYEGALGKMWETQSFWATLLTGTRTLVEQQPVVDYVGEDGLGPLCVTVLLLFLFATLVVLLNILIARLSDTYQNIQRDAQRSLELDRAWIVTRVERHSVLTDFRKKFYKKVKIVQDMYEKLEKWESPPVSDRTRMLVDLQEKMENQDIYLRSLGQRLHTTHRTSQQIQMRLISIKSLLKKLVAEKDAEDGLDGGKNMPSVRHAYSVEEGEHLSSVLSEISYI